MQVYVPVQVNKFVTAYEKIELCDCVDEVFYTDEEIREIRNSNYGGTRHLKRELIDPILQSILQKYNDKPQNKKTIVVKEIEQLTCCKDDDYYHLIEDELRDFLNEHKIQRVGTRLSPKAQQAKKLVTNNQIITILRRVFSTYCLDNYGFDLEPKFVDGDERRCNFMKLLKVNMTFEQIVSLIENLDPNRYCFGDYLYNSFTNTFTNNTTNFERLKQVYENPELLNPTVV